MRDHQAARRGDRGSTTVEVAVLLPLMMLLVMVIVQTGLWFHTRAVMATAANKGLDAARVDGGTPAEGEQATEDFLSHAGALREPSIDIDRGADTTEVTVSGQVVSLIFGAPISITVTVEAPTEQVTP
ncbi:MAG: TadE/TadG family type IV pilus assembly protein [Acidimicrobiales bacterium]